MTKSTCRACGVPIEFVPSRAYWRCVGTLRRHVCEPPRPLDLSTLDKALEFLS